ncbi:MAG: hypothetical protein ACYTGO_13880 [Planctomycetota bacterium]|jgi:ferredoxin
MGIYRVFEANDFPPGSRPSDRRSRTAQRVLVGLAVLTLVALLVAPAVGLHAVWNVAVPILPALLVLAPGVWRNICPLSFIAAVPQRLGIAHNKQLPQRLNDLFLLIAVVTLFLVLPLRHVLLDKSGLATALTLVLLGLGAATAGLLFKSRSGWCAGLCPVHPVEKLYGARPVVTTNNSECLSCVRCVAVCPDSTPQAIDEDAKANDHTNDSRLRNLCTTIMLGAFPGYVYGWFHVPDYAPGQGMAHLGDAYGLPLVTALVTLAVLICLRATLGRLYYGLLNRAFAASAVAFFYWFRLPALVGFGLVPGDGMLVDLSPVLWEGWVMILRLGVVTFLFYWLVRDRFTPTAWTETPRVAPDVARQMAEDAAQNASEDAAQDEADPGTATASPGKPAARTAAGSRGKPAARAARTARTGRKSPASGSSRT